MTAIQPGLGLLCLLNNLRHAGSDDLPAAISAHIRRQIEEGQQLPDPYLDSWFDLRDDDRTLIVLLDPDGNAVSAAEVPSGFAESLHKRLPASSLPVKTWGGETR